MKTAPLETADVQATVNALLAGIQNISQNIEASTPDDLTAKMNQIDELARIATIINNAE